MSKRVRSIVAIGVLAAGALGIVACAPAKPPVTQPAPQPAPAPAPVTDPPPPTLAPPPPLPPETSPVRVEYQVIGAVDTALVTMNTTDASGVYHGGVNVGRDKYDRVTIGWKPGAAVFLSVEMVTVPLTTTPVPITCRILFDGRVVDEHTLAMTPTWPTPVDPGPSCHAQVPWNTP